MATPRFPRVVVAVAQPDDETLALGPLLPSLAQAALGYATDGAPRSARAHRPSTSPVAP